MNEGSLVLQMDFHVDLGHQLVPGLVLVNLRPCLPPHRRPKAWEGPEVTLQLLTHHDTLVDFPGALLKFG